MKKYSREIKPEDAHKYQISLLGCSNPKEFHDSVYYAIEVTVKEENGEDNINLLTGKPRVYNDFLHISYCGACFRIKGMTKRCLKCEYEFQPSCNNKHLCFKCMLINSGKPDEPGQYQKKNSTRIGKD
jgi:hypothetical protein